jgi:hypothetical protein
MRKKPLLTDRGGYRPVSAGARGDTGLAVARAAIPRKRDVENMVWEWG